MNLIPYTYIPPGSVERAPAPEFDGLDSDCQPLIGQCVDVLPSMWLKWANFSIYIWLYTFCALLLNIVEDLSVSFFLFVARREQGLCSWHIRLLLLSHNSSPRILSERVMGISQASLFYCLPVGYVSNLLCLVHPPLHSINPGMRKVVAMSSASLILVICYLEICRHTIPTRMKDIWSNVFLSFLEVYLKKNCSSFLPGIHEVEVSSSFHGFSFKGLVHRVYI